MNTLITLPVLIPMIGMIACVLAWRMGRVQRITNLVFSVSLLVSGVLLYSACLLYTSPSPRDRTRPRMPSSA